jgi:hypothetical protein
MAMEKENETFLRVVKILILDASFPVIQLPEVLALSRTTLTAYQLLCGEASNGNKLSYWNVLLRALGKPPYKYMESAWRESPRKTVMRNLLRICAICWKSYVSRNNSTVCALFIECGIPVCSTCCIIHSLRCITTRTACKNYRVNKAVLLQHLSYTTLTVCNYGQYGDMNLWVRADVAWLSDLIKSFNGSKNIAVRTRRWLERELQKPGADTRPSTLHARRWQQSFIQTIAQEAHHVRQERAQKRTASSNSPPDSAEYHPQKIQKI